MTIRNSLAESACFALVLLALLSGAGPVFAQQQGPVEAGASASSREPRNASDDGAMSSTEQGRTPLPDSFQSWREWRIEKRRDALRDTEFRFNIRAYYFDREKFDGSGSEAFTIGGLVGLKTGYFLDHISFGVTGYTSQGLHAPDDEDGTGLLKPGQESITVLGEAYADIRIIDDLHLYVGRKEFDTPFINGDDSRMIPNTFEAITLQGRIEFGNGGTDPSKDGVEHEGGSALKFGVGYFDRIKPRNLDEFISMAEAAGTQVNRGVYTAGALYENGNFTIGAIDYYCPDIINIGYAETTLKLPINQDWESRFAAQFVDQRSVGDNLLQVDDFAGQQYGIKAELQFKKALFTVAYTQTTDGTDMQAPWSSFPNYTSVQVQDFNRAGEGAILVRAAYEFTTIKGLSTYALAVFGTEPNEPGQYRQNEYDFNVQWMPPEGVLKGFSLRLRYAVVQQDEGAVQDIQDFRVICNYGLTF
jgi:hypothetical protein